MKVQYNHKSHLHEDAEHSNPDSVDFIGSVDTSSVRNIYPGRRKRSLPRLTEQETIAAERE